MNKRIGLVLLLMTLGAIAALLYAQQPRVCYGGSLGFEITDEAQRLVDEQALSLPDMQATMLNALNRYQQMTNTCFTGEMGQIHGTLPNRVFVVFQASNEGYGVTRVMTEGEYYPPPFDATTAGWQRNSPPVELPNP